MTLISSQRIHRSRCIAGILISRIADVFRTTKRWICLRSHNIVATEWFPQSFCLSNQSICRRLHLRGLAITWFLRSNTTVLRTILARIDVFRRIAVVVIPLLVSHACVSMTSGLVLCRAIQILIQKQHCQPAQNQQS